MNQEAVITRADVGPTAPSQLLLMSQVICLPLLQKSNITTTRWVKLPSQGQALPLGVSLPFPATVYSLPILGISMHTQVFLRPSFCMFCSCDSKVYMMIMACHFLQKTFPNYSDREWNYDFICTVPKWWYSTLTSYLSWFCHFTFWYRVFVDQAGFKWNLPGSTLLSTGITGVYYY